MVFQSQRSLVNKQVKCNVLTAKKSVHTHCNSKHWNNTPIMAVESISLIFYIWNELQNKQCNYKAPQVESNDIWESFAVIYFLFYYWKFLTIFLIVLFKNKKNLLLLESLSCKILRLFQFAKVYPLHFFLFCL